eukprot:16947-Heterococcus_DN1.PRE.1
MNAADFAQHIHARGHIALERLDIAKEYDTLLTMADQHIFFRTHLIAYGRMFRWNLVRDPEAAALRTAIYASACTIDNGFISDDGLF